MLNEFKSFILRGNIIDLATGVIIGAAFGKIVTSLVEDIILPPIGLLINNVDFKHLKQVIGGTTKDPVSINYGNFLQIVIEFLIIAFCLFLILKGVNTLTKKQLKEEPVVPPAPSAETELLIQIRDILKTK